MKKLKENAKRIGKQDVLLWLVIAAALVLTLRWMPPHERWERGQRILLLTILICCFSRNRKKL